MENSVEQLKALFEQFLMEDAKFEKGNNAAGTRARKALGEMTKLAKARRLEISAEREIRKQAKSV
jgi:hypothetical protein